MAQIFFKDTPRGLSGIYKITNKITQKVYIGQSVDIRRRWTAHINILNDTNANAIEKSSAIHQSMLKYGIENFTFEIVELCSIDQLNDREKFWIQSYNSYLRGYNETIGGDGIRIRPSYVDAIQDALQHTMQSYQEIATTNHVAVQVVSTINRGVTYFDETLSYPLRSHTKEVIQYDLHGNELSRFATVTEAANAVNTSTTHISGACSGKYKSTRGFIWRYASDPLQEVPHTTHSRKTIVQFDLNHNIIAEYISGPEAEKMTGFNRKCITNACLERQKGKNTTYKNFIWEYKQED